jgi:hypothetical protein
MVVGSYAAYACCIYVSGSWDVCRRMTTDTVQDPLYYGDFTCTLDPNTNDDENVTPTGEYTLDYGDTCFVDRTDCAISYYCSNGQVSGVHMNFEYPIPSGAATFVWLDCHTSSSCPTLNQNCP